MGSEEAPPQHAAAQEIEALAKQMRLKTAM
jgi:hypothetical protein